MRVSVLSRGEGAFAISSRAKELAAHVWRTRAWLLPSTALFAWLVVLAFLIPYHPDESIYKVIAVDVVDGHWPYEHLFINRQPLFFLAFLPVGLTGSIELQRLVAAAAIVASVPLFLVLARRWLEGRQVPLSVLSYCLLLANPFMITGAQTESFLLAPLLAAMIVPSAVLAGVFIGAALMLKATVLPLVLAILVIRRTGLRVTVITAASVCVAVVIPFIPVWSEFWEANVTFTFSYARFTLAERLVNTLPIHWSVFLGALPIWVATWIGAFGERRWALWLFLLAGVLSAKSTGFNWNQYYALIALPGALFAGMGLDYLLREGRVPTLGRVLMVPATLMSIGVLVVSLSIFAVRQHRPYADLVAGLEGRAGEVYVLGGHPEIYAYADRQPERRFYFSALLVMNGDYGESTRAGLLACPPALLVLPTASDFEVEWAEDVAALYRTRLEFENASLFAEPKHECTTANVKSGRDS